MFPISPAFEDVLDTTTGRNRFISWWGTITLTNGTIYDFDSDHIAQGTGILTTSCELPGVGGAYSTEFQAQFFLPISPRSLKDAVIALYVRLSYSATAVTWNEIENFHWNEISSTKWGDNPRMIYTDVPMGLFSVIDATRTINSIKITAYDNMLKFDTSMPVIDDTAQTPYNWLLWMCATCGVGLGMTSTDFSNLPNGTRCFTYAEVNDNVKTCRDLVGHVAALVGAIAIIDRYGKLVLVRHGTDSVAEITPDNRFSSTFADYQYSYTGLWAQYKAKGVQEYYINVDSAADDDGLIIDLGTNVFLQISNNNSRSKIIQAIIDAFKGVHFTPFEVSVPFNPTFDLLDVLVFSGGHTPQNSYGPITTIKRVIGGAMTLQCATPKEQENPTRKTVDINGVSGESAIGNTGYASGEFWILIDAYPDAEIEVSDGEGDISTTHVDLNCTVDNARTHIAWTGAYVLDEDATITVKVLLNREVIYTVSDDQKAGNHVMNVTTGYDIERKGEYAVDVTISETAIAQDVDPDAPDDPETDESNT